MVVSSACMMVAVMAQIVTMFRRTPGTATGDAASVLIGSVLCRDGWRQPEHGGQRAAMSGVDRDIRTHAGLELAYQLVVGIERDPHRHPLHHLDEIAGSVLRRQDGELRAGA